MSALRDRLLQRMTESLSRLHEMLAIDAPDTMLSGELEILGETGRMLDPEGCARRRATHDEMRAKRYAEVCLQHGCDAHATHAEHCDEHQDILGC